MKFFSAGKECEHKNHAELTVRNQSDAVAGKPVGVAEFKKTVLPTVNTAAAISPITAGFKPDISPATILLLLNFL